LMVEGSKANEFALEQHDKAMTSGLRQKPFILELRHKNGSKVTFEIDESPVVDGDGKVVGMIGAAKDIGEKMEQENNFRTFLDAAGVVIVALDTEGRVTLVNRKFSEVLLYTSEELVGKNWFEKCVDEKDRIGIEKVFHELMHGNADSVEYYENQVLAKDGSKKLIAWHNAVLRDQSGKVTGTIGSGSDVTEERAQEVTNKKNRELLDCYQKTLLKMSTQSLAGESDISIVRGLMLKQVADVMDVERVGYWTVDVANMELRCVDLYEKLKDVHVSGETLTLREDSKYLAALRESRYIDASEARTDERTVELNAIYLEKMSIFSLLDAPVRTTEKVIGVLCVEQTGKVRTWNQDDISFVSGVADQISRGYLAEEKNRRAAELERINKLMIGRELRMVELKRELEKNKSVNGTI
jgi:PAS domain S-box-containing protein